MGEGGRIPRFVNIGKERENGEVTISFPFITD